MIGQDMDILRRLKVMLFESLEMKIVDSVLTENVGVVYAVSYAHDVWETHPDAEALKAKGVYLIEDSNFDIDLDPYFKIAWDIYESLPHEKEFLKRDNLPQDFREADDEPEEENIVD